MSDVWDEARIDQYIKQGIEESLTLEYKAAGSLAKNDFKREEISKDVSAMANSAGGFIVYGLREYQDQARRHMPEKIDPIDRTQFSKEWLEHVISNIRPKIDGLVIHPISISTEPNHAVYVVEIPQSHTAHQATDKKYYKRFNFESVAMEDYEIRDVMGRRQNAHIILEFKIQVRTERVSSWDEYWPLPSSSQKKQTKTQTVYELKVRMKNTGKVYAQFVNAFIEMPCDIVFNFEREYLHQTDHQVDLEQYCTYTRNNTIRDVIKHGSGGPIGSSPEYGPARYDPVLPGLSRKVDDFRLNKDFETINWGDHKVRWIVYADNASPNSGEIAIKDIEVVDKRNKASDEDAN